MELSTISKFEAKEGENVTNRRAFLQQSMATALGLGALGPQVWAETRRSAGRSVDPHFLVFVQIYGAWDICLAMDPKDRDLRLSNGDKAFDQPYGWDEVRSFGPHLLAPQGLALAPFADRMTIVNGIDMELDGGHTPQIVMAGDIQANALGKPFVQAMLSERHPYLRSRLMPHLYGSYDGLFLAGPYGSKTVAIAAADAYRVLNGRPTSLDLKQVQVTTRALSEAYTGLDKQLLNQYAKAVDQAVELRRRFKEGDAPVENPGNSRTLARFVGKLFASETLGSFTWSLADTYAFDTHAAHYANHPLKQGLEDLAAFCQELQSLPWDEHTSLFDHTTVVLTAEFSRSPRLNSSQGKDHNFRANSLVLFGKNVRSASFGKSGEIQDAGQQPFAHAGLPIDFRSGEPKVDGQKLNMRHLWAGSGAILGADLSNEFGPTTEAVSFLQKG